MMLCANEECKFKFSCARFTNIPVSEYQSYFKDAKVDCEENDYTYFVSNDN
ncbi:hypothetical protein [Psychrobacillus phage Perkons]|nr:hypothetical protein [Psychrobacillus phage Perkons]